MIFKLIFALYLTIIKLTNDLFEVVEFVAIEKNCPVLLQEIQVAGFSLTHSTFGTTGPFLLF